MLFNFQQHFKRQGSAVYEPEKSLVIEFIRSLLSTDSLQKVRRHPRFAGEYFLILLNFLKISEIERLHLLKNQYLDLLIHFYLGTGRSFASRTAVSQNSPKCIYISGPTLPADQTVYLVQSLSILLRNCLLNLTPENLKGQVLDKSLVSLLPPTFSGDLVYYLGPNTEILLSPVNPSTWHLF